MDKKLNDLWKIVKDENISVKYRNLRLTPEKLNGMYIFHKNVGQFIILDIGLLTNYRKHREVLAEEVGHAIVGAKTNIIYTSKSYSDEILRNKDEYRAMRWATTKLIPDHELCAALESGCRECYELADYFNVTVPFMILKLHYLKQCFRRTGLKVKGRDILSSLRIVSNNECW